MYDHRHVVWIRLKANIIHSENIEAEFISTVLLHNIVFNIFPLDNVFIAIWFFLKYSGHNLDKNRNEANQKQSSLDCIECEKYFAVCSFFWINKIKPRIFLIIIIYDIERLVCFFLYRTTSLTPDVPIYW